MDIKVQKRGEEQQAKPDSLARLGVPAVSIPAANAGREYVDSSMSGASVVRSLKQKGVGRV